MTSFFIKVYGCAHNIAEAERMAGLLRQAQFEKVNELEDADIIIVHTCTVKSRVVDSFFHKLDEMKKQFPYKSIIISGCIPQSQPEKLKEFSLLGTKQIHKIVEVVEETINNNIVKNLETGEMPPLNLPKIRKNPFVEIIPISLGCLSACTFCKTKHARGNLQSYPVEDIVNVAKAAVNDGVKEVWITSQDTMCYGFDMNTNLPTLLKELITIPGDFKIRVGMGNPVHLKKIQEDLIPLFKHPKLFKFIHLPMQAGSDTVLKDMRRGNTTKDFIDMVHYIKETVPNVTIATDIIVGFPTEDETDFWQTLEVVRKTTPDVINISRFWPRPGTPAADMEQVPVDEIKRRTAVLTDIFHNISRLSHEKWIGWEGSILVTEKGKFENQWIGKNDSYKQVIVEGDFNVGDVVSVKIVKSGTFDLRGKVIEKEVKVDVY